MPSFDPPRRQHRPCEHPAGYRLTVTVLSAPTTITFDLEA